MPPHPKKVVEHISGWLTLYDDGSVDRTWTGSPHAKFMVEPVPPHHRFINGLATADVVDHVSGLKLRIYLPEKTEDDPEKLPVLLHFHGGGFCVSEPDWYIYYTSYSNMARTVRAIVVSVYHRQAPEHRLPAACDDGFAALLYLRSIAGWKSHEPWMNRADFNRVFLIGESAGGNIVHNVAVRAGDENLEPLRLAGAVLMHSGFCRSRRSKSEVELPKTHFLTVEMIDKMLGLAVPKGETKDYPIICPMGEAVEEMKLPPYLYCVAEKALLFDTQMEFYECLKKGKKEVELIMNEGVEHCFYFKQAEVEINPKIAAETEKLYQGIKQFVVHRH